LPKRPKSKPQPGSRTGEIQNAPQNDGHVWAARRPVTAALLLIGLCSFLALGQGRGIGWQRWIAIAVVTVIALLPPVARVIERFLVPLQSPSASLRRFSPILVLLISTTYLILTAFLQQRDLFPKTHDEYSYLLGMKMLARGRLWMPPHPMADFFESFYILSKPVYASIYFPGTSLTFVPAIWLSLPPWLLPVVVGGASITLLFCINSKLIDPAAGWLSVLLVLSLTWFRTITMMLMSQAPMLLLGLAIVWAWLHWRDNCRWYWLLAIGVFAGWGAITRPIDALAYALPVGLGMLLDIAGGQGSRPGGRGRGGSRRAIMWLNPAALVVAGAAPFLLLQVIFNLGVTSHIFQTPYTLYLQREQPGATFGFHQFDPAAKGQSTLPQMQKDLEFSKTYFALHQLDNFWNPWLITQHPQGFADRPAYLAMIADATLPVRFLLMLLPVGLLALTTRPRQILFLTFPLFIFLYVLNPFFLEHYAIVLIPSVILCLLLSIETLARAFPTYRTPITSALTALLIASTLTGLWEINHLLVANPQYQVSDEPLRSALLQKSHDLHGQRAVVLYKWDSTRNWKEEPVCNSDVAWPDDAEVVRAHDLGPRDVEIINYYAGLQPDRMFFLWDEKADTLTKLGSAADLRQALLSGQNLETLLHPPH
jgi:hypothetical protein